MSLSPYPPFPSYLPHAPSSAKTVLLTPIQCRSTCKKILVLPPDTGPQNPEECRERTSEQTGPGQQRRGLKAPAQAGQAGTRGHRF